MAKIPNERTLAELLTRFVERIYPSADALEKELLSGNTLKIYLGVDATGPHLHLGHLTNFLWLKKMQELGHQIIFLIGDFTGRVGDPTDKMAERKPLEESQVKRNMKTFKQQAMRVISFSSSSGNPVKVRYNSTWYKKMKLEKFMYGLLSYFSVQNLFARIDAMRRVTGNENESVQELFSRGDFAKRMIEGNNPIQLKEFIYPLLQGYDGVVLDVDIELGGRDQIFNMGIGRALRVAYINQQERKWWKPGGDGKWWKLGGLGRAHDATTDSKKFSVATKLLEDPRTGKKIMNKSEGGTINLDDPPEELFGKIMAVSDAGMFEVAELCTEMGLEHIKELKKGVDSGALNPKITKQEIAVAVVRVLCGERAALEAEQKFSAIFSRREMPVDLPKLRINGKISALDVVIASGAAKSKSEARRLIGQGAVKVGGKAKEDPNEILALEGGEVVRIGKKHFFRIEADRRG